MKSYPLTGKDDRFLEYSEGRKFFWGYIVLNSHNSAPQKEVA